MRLILVTGSDSPAGQAFIAELKAAGLAWLGFDGQTCRQSHGVLAAQLAGLTQVSAIVHLHDDCSALENDTNTEPFFQTPVDISRCIGEFAGRLELPLIHLSSFQVFDGEKKNPYIAANALSPIGAYGQSKAAAERELLLTAPRLVILRQGFSLDDAAQGWLDQRISEFLSGQPVLAAQAPMFNPTPVADLARVLLAVLQQIRCGVEAWGAYHYGGVEAVSHAQLVSAVYEYLHGVLGDKVDSAQIQAQTQLPDRVLPVNGRLSCIKIRNTFGIKQRSWRPTLAALIQARLQALRGEAENPIGLTA